MIGNYKWQCKALCVFVTLIAVLTLSLFLSYPLIAKGLYHCSQEAMEAYVALQHYLLSPESMPLKVPHYVLTQKAVRHFQDVKSYVLCLEAITLCLLPTSLYLLYKDWKARYFYMWHIQLKQWLYLPIIVLVAVFVLGFNTTFILFHRLLFQNNDWIFNEPIIHLFPVSLFQTLALLWLILYYCVIYGGYVYTKKKGEIE